MFTCLKRKKNNFTSPALSLTGSWKFHTIYATALLVFKWGSVLFLYKSHCPKTMQYFNALSLLNLISLLQ